MELQHTQTDGKITYCLFIESEDIPVKGSFASGDDAADAKLERSIMSSLQDGNQWAWCLVKVEARHNDYPGIAGVDYLGACSYRNTLEFIQPGGYWDDMKSEALSELMGRIPVKAGKR